MKKRGGVRKGVGRPQGRKATPPADVDESAVMTAQAAAEYLHCHRVTLYRLANQGKIPGFRFGGEWRFLKSDLDRWIAKGEGQG
jgi:excisionase family DNA binding protein